MPKHQITNLNVSYILVLISHHLTQFSTNYIQAVSAQLLDECSVRFE